MRACLLGTPSTHAQVLYSSCENHVFQVELVEGCNSPTERQTWFHDGNKCIKNFAYPEMIENHLLYCMLSTTTMQGKTLPFRLKWLGERNGGEIVPSPFF
mmetsp:Transcript_26245/g.40251  ORF Transcript_26245/g.40251 Transcript_26245/m.40251 type:complete len:100 (-) Transcript_26245:412-711(-)